MFDSCDLLLIYLYLCALIFKAKERRHAGHLPGCRTVVSFIRERELVRYNAIARPSVVCNSRAPYSGGSNFRQYFYGIRYLVHPLTSTENSTEIVPGELLSRGR